MSETEDIAWRSILKNRRRMEAEEACLGDDTPVTKEDFERLIADLKMVVDNWDNEFLTRNMGRAENEEFLRKHGCSILVGDWKLERVKTWNFLTPLQQPDPS